MGGNSFSILEIQREATVGNIRGDNYNTVCSIIVETLLTVVFVVITEHKSLVHFFCDSTLC
jgi:hypothetical protein